MTSDLARAVFSPTISELHPADPASRGGLGSMNMDEILRNFYATEGVDPAPRKVEGDEVVEMTLEDFLARAGAGPEEDPILGFGDGVGGEGGILGFGDGVEGEGVGRGRGRKRAAMDPADRAAMQRQKRMIKNRESAARSRERKQAYTVELEKLVHELEEENARLLRGEEEQRKERLKQLMENLIPVTESKKPPRFLRRTMSWQWTSTEKEEVNRGVTS